MEETQYQYITSGVKQVVEKVLTQLPSSTARTDTTSASEAKTLLPLIKTDIPPVVETIQDIVQLSLQEMIVLVMYVEKALALEHSKPVQIPIKSEITKDLIKDVVKTKIKNVKDKNKKLKKVTEEEKVKVTTPLIDEPMMKTITNLKDEKKFKEIHPNFEPSESDAKLKGDVEQIIKMTFQDTKKLAIDKNLTKAQRELGLMENLLVDSVLSGNKTLRNVKTFEAFEIENHNLAVAYEKRIIPITWKMYLESINFIKTWGIPCMMFDEHEAEAMCASLVTLGLADATVSEDMDTTLFGDGILLRQFFKKNLPILEISPVEARKSLELSHDQYIDLCILCGTDFAGTIRNVGPITALKLIKKHGSIENILPSLKPEKHLIAPDFITEVEAARNLYKNPPQITKDILKQLESNTENIDEFNRLLERFEIDSTTNEPLDYNVIVYDVNSAENIDGVDLGPDPFSANTIKITEL
ncbi:hypothetical protein C1645_749043 [Glomus cerebriforme]|uniref:XPG-I domain-containing protein n=1 Tax=Glomus cerebriforme TaxID=658196 RepID=A0A397TQ73_9GLOM|nr:hypothetical protein C1645_749043 [Glomus cerebriforme]